MNVKLILIEKLIENQHTGIILFGKVQVTPEQIQLEINRRVAISRRGVDNGYLFARYAQLGLI